MIMEKLFSRLNAPSWKMIPPDSLAQRIHALEHEYYPKVIEEVVSQISH